MNSNDKNIKVDDINLTEETQSSETVFQGRFLKVQRDQVKTPAGGISHREYILHPGAAMIIPLLPDHKVLILRQYRHALKQVFWEFPAGKCDKGEPSYQTAQRELQEETGYTCNHLQMLTRIHPVIGYANEFIDIYLAENLQFVGQNLDADEALSIYTMSIEELKQLVFRGEVTDVKTQIGYFWLESHLAGKIPPGK